MAQQFIPAFPEYYNTHLLLLQMAFLCASVTVGAPTMLVLAFIGGFLWDTQCHISPIAIQTEILQSQVESLSFGYSILLFALSGFLMQGLQPLFQRGKWYFTTFLSGFALFLYQFCEALLINYVRGGFLFSRDMFYQILLTAVFTMLFAPVFFAILFTFARWCQHTITFEGLQKPKNFHL